MSFTHCNHNIYYYIPIHDLYVIQVKNTTSQISYPVSCCGLKSRIKLPPCVINYCVVMLNWCNGIFRMKRNVKDEIKCPTNKNSFTVLVYNCHSHRDSGEVRGWWVSSCWLHPPAACRLVASPWSPRPACVARGNAPAPRWTRPRLQVVQWKLLFLASMIINHSFYDL